MKRSIWAAIPTGDTSGGVWQRVIVTPQAGGEFDLWQNLGERPGGMWGDLEKETLLIHERQAANIWDAVDDETLIIRPRYDLWREIQRIPPPPRADRGIWAQLADETLAQPQASADVWSATTQAGDYTRHKPARRLGWALKKLHTVGGEGYYILKNLRAGTYLRLSEEQVFLWNLMDGQHSVRDMAVAYFERYKSLAVEGLLSLLGQLDAKGFLVESRGDLFASTAQALGQNRLQRLRSWLVGAFLQKTFSISGIDNALSRLYKAGLFLVFTRPVQVIILLITLAGLAAFGYHAWLGNYSLLRGGSGGLAMGLAGLYLAQFFAILLHEAAHAFACKHFGREVHRAGFMIYLGMPAFFVETSDIWMEPRRPRILVTWAGPYSGFFLAAVASLLIFVMPSPLAGLLYQFAMLCLLLSFVNLNPLLQLDGYFILMDWLEMPMLRARALDFVRKDLWPKLLSGESFEREEKIFAVFGLLSLVWTAVAIFTAIWLIGNTLLGFLQGVLGPTWGLALLITLAALLAIVLLWPFFQRRKRASI